MKLQTIVALSGLEFLIEDSKLSQETKKILKDDLEVAKNVMLKIFMFEAHGDHWLTQEAADFASTEFPKIYDLGVQEASTHSYKHGYKAAIEAMQLK